jgi:hypothetical protein
MKHNTLPTEVISYLQYVINSMKPEKNYLSLIFGINIESEFNCVISDNNTILIKDNTRYVKCDICKNNNSNYNITITDSYRVCEKFDVSYCDYFFNKIDDLYSQCVINAKCKLQLFTHN